MYLFLLWLLLAILAWPVALLALVLYPVAWILSIPFRLVGISMRAVFELLETVIRLPSRLLQGASAR